ncbi:hypothetical protein [Psychromonas aquimarina]|uniref:hypothetical protein n=1 Tax=Psychromonas aquimarina TaxID=444919 RepID=UPI00041AAC98|nr:hypothetical protein [Psychromonas aquimarina]
MDYITAQLKSFIILIFTLLMLSLNCAVSRAAVVDSELGFELELPERWIKLDQESAQSIYAQALSLFKKKKISKAQFLEFRELFSVVESSTDTVFMPVDIIGLLKKKEAYSVVWLSLEHKHLPQNEKQVSAWCKTNREPYDIDCSRKTADGRTVMVLERDSIGRSGKAFAYTKTVRFYQLSNHVSLAFSVFGSGDYDPDALLFKQNINKSTIQVVKKIGAIYKQAENISTAEQAGQFITNLQYVADFGDPQANTAIAEYLTNTGKPQQAENYLHKAIAAPWHLADAMYALALLYHANPELVDSSGPDTDQLIAQAASKGYKPALELVEQAVTKGNANALYIKYQLTEEVLWLHKAAEKSAQAMLHLALLNYQEEQGEVIGLVRNAQEITAADKLSIHELKRLTPFFAHLLRINTMINTREQPLSEHKTEYQALLKSIFEKSLAPLSASQALSESEWSAVYYQAKSSANRSGDPLFDIIEKYKNEAAGK